jgi:prepilin peptidase CpaA
MPVQPYLDLVLLLLVAAAAINDLATRRIPNRLLLLAWLVVLPLHTLGPAPGHALLDCLAGATVGLLVFLPLYLLRGMAAGDVKLMATVGAIVGPAAAFDIAILSWCAGGLMALAIILAGGHARAAFGNVAQLLRPHLMRAFGMPAAAEPLERPSVGSMPYGLAVAIGTLYAVWSGHI